MVRYMLYPRSVNGSSTVHDMLRDTGGDMGRVIGFVGRVLRYGWVGHASGAMYFGGE